jgi:dihydroorotate dehydrogenase
MSVAIGRVVWPGPVGIGAGLVKGAATLIELSQKADSVEVGSITKNARLGNEGQTVWKFSEELGLRHNVGLPNPGAMQVVEWLKVAQYKVVGPWGMNVAVSPGLMKTELAAADVGETVARLLKGGLRPDWVTFNCSSPDTKDSVFSLAEPQRVRACLAAIKQTSSLFNVPLWIKIGHGLTKTQYESLAEVMLELRVDAVVVGNALPAGELPGGWCGTPVYAHMKALVWEMKRLTEKRIPIVALGGIQTGRQVEEVLAAGAAAVQVVSALLFRGREAAEKIRREYDLLLA